jgi:ankyrin repeat protein
MVSEALAPELIREFVLAGHGNLEKVRSLLSRNPQLLKIAYEWTPDDHESAIQAAAHVGNRPITVYLLEQGAPIEICTAAMLGRRGDVEQMLTGDSSLIAAKGAHGIPLLTHAALSGDATLVQMLYERGARTGASAALGNAVSKGHTDVVRWLLQHASPNLEWKNFQGKTFLSLAEEGGHQEIAKLLRERGAR